MKPYFKPSSWKCHPLVSPKSTCYTAGIQKAAKLRAALCSQAESLRKAGYEIADEVPITMADQIMRDLANAKSAFCQKFPLLALRVMKIVRQMVPGMLPVSRH